MAYQQINSSLPINNVGNQEVLVGNNLTLGHIDFPSNHLTPLGTGNFAGFQFITGTVLGSGQQAKIINISPAHPNVDHYHQYKHNTEWLQNSIDGVASPFIYTNEWQIYQASVGIVAGSAVFATGQTLARDVGFGGYGNVQVAIFSLPRTVGSGFLHNTTG